MIEVENLTKRYGPTLAVSDVTFEAQKGEVLGFLGPNGAGKTTTMRVITGYLPPSEGRVRVAGYDVVEEPLEAKRRTGYLPETPPVYPDMTVTEYLAFVGRIKGVARRELKSRLDGNLGEMRDHRRASSADRQTIERVPAARGLGPGADPQPRGSGSRRADGGPRSQTDHRNARAHQGLGGSAYRHPQHPHSSRGLQDLPARRGDQCRQDRGGGNSGRTHSPPAGIRDHPADRRGCGGGSHGKAAAGRRRESGGSRTTPPTGG